VRLGARIFCSSVRRCPRQTRSVRACTRARTDPFHALRGRRDGAAFDLTPRELAVLALLHRERGNAISRDRILNEVWGIEYYGTTRTLDQVIVKIRQKIESEPATPRHLLTVHGLGYRLEV
jgi:DNA-binding response OmpR family regulator